ncbi:hypothetical protein NE235_24950 [Actinoallomurus spadix]|uniref:Uncharacterized protein n=1 Tax=Actinoallomurus spadix TaxID=79912 RepID=A0ABN0WGD1_9ACTN|nr:hypothetical protein [Actinoallomurus spadix]MCO5989359.1 hypothetical protein [Actinoallomurus spadix]
MLVSSLEERVSALEKDVQILRMATHGWAEVAVAADRKVGGVPELLNLIYGEIALIKETLARHDEHFTAIETRLGGVEDRIDRVETRLDGIETHLGGVESRLDGMDPKLDLILDRLAA